MTWRPNLKLRPGRRKTFDAKHNQLYAEVEAQRALAKQYEDDINLVPESHFDGDQVRLDFESKQDRRAERRQRFAQTGAYD
ncbi:MAG TPA: hypothetical protein VKR31_10340 [Rhizomicrobium sp.]|nr:hypothetical protein [Rhizomicrobium sp.]